MITLIAALDMNNCIGRGSQLPWHIPDEMAHFKANTDGQIVIMGRKTFNRFKRPLRNRTNVVVASLPHPTHSHDNLVYVNSLETALGLFGEDDKRERFIIGGAMLYDYALKADLVDQLLLSRIHGIYEGDVYFPRIPDRKWEEVYIIRNNLFDIISMIRGKK